MLFLTLSARDCAMHWSFLFLWWWRCPAGNSDQFEPRRDMQCWCPRNLDDRFHSCGYWQVCKRRLEGGAKIAMIITYNYDKLTRHKQHQSCIQTVAWATNKAILQTCYQRLNWKDTCFSFVHSAKLLLDMLGCVPATQMCPFKLMHSKFLSQLGS